MNARPVVFYHSLTAAFSEFVDRLLEWVMLWPLLCYAGIFHIQPELFSRGMHYSYMATWGSQKQWEVTLLIIAFLRVTSLVTKMFWRWPFYSPIALIAALCAGTAWAQVSMSFLLIYLRGDGALLGAFGAVSTMALIEIINVRHSARGVGALLKRGRD